jgi:hypothetical protein
MFLVWGGLIFLIAHPIYRGFFWGEDFLHLYFGKIFFSDFGLSSATTLDYFRPSLDLLINLYYQVAGGDYTVYMVFMHLMFLVMCVQVFFLLNRFLKNKVISFLLTCVFSVCSLYSEVFYYFSAGISELLVSIYILAVVLLYIYRRKLYWLVVILYSLAVFFKETAIIIPFFLFAFDIYKGIVIKEWIKKRWLLMLIMVAQLLIKVIWIGSSKGFSLRAQDTLNFFTSFVAHLVILLSSPGFQFFRIFGEVPSKVFVIIVSIIILIILLILMRRNVMEFFKQNREVLFSLLWIVITLLPAVVILIFGYKISSPLSVSAGRQFLLPFIGYLILIGFFVNRLWDRGKLIKIFSIIFIVIYFIGFGISGNMVNVKSTVELGKTYKRLFDEIEQARDEGELNIVVVGTAHKNFIPGEIIYGVRDLYMYEFYYGDKEGSYQSVSNIEEARRLMPDEGGRIIIWKDNDVKKIIDL